MIPKAVVAVTPPAAAVIVMPPTEWSLLGYPVEAASICTAIIACVCVRVWSNARDAQHRWTVDAPVTLLTLLFTAAATVKLHPDPITAALLGTGLGAVGEGIIRKAKDWADRWLGGVSGETPSKEKDPAP